MINPYENVGWESVGHVKSMSHMHLHNQNSFEAAIKEGFKHVAATNYQPSVPTYPLDKFFTNIPYDVIGSPNTEKVYTTNLGGAGHFCSLGSFAKGHGHTEGATTTWQNVFDEILSELQFEDGGGVTINHPGDRFFVGFDTYKEMLDHDDRVLGIEIYNRDGAGRDENGKYQPLFYTELWDELLKTGRRCWGFAAIDWQMPTNNWGSNLLLVPEFTEHACLKAYRDGAFYAQIKDTGLRFTEIRATEEKMTVSVNRECEIKFFTSRGNVKTVIGTSASCDVADGEIFMRAEAKDINDPDSHILMNPVMFHTRNKQ